VVEKIDGAFTGFAVGAYEVEVVSIVELIAIFIVNIVYLWAHIVELKEVVFMRIMNHLQLLYMQHLQRTMLRNQEEQ